MTILKIICPALGGFIIDHVQYTLNIFFISLFLTIFSYIYFLGYCWKLIQDYLYFAIGFQILAQQLQTIIIQTMVSKHFPEDQIPRQLALFYQYGYAGRLLCAIITLIIYYRLEKLNTVSIITGEISTIVMSSIPLVILLSLTICFQRSFKTFKVDAFQKIPELQLIPIQSKGNLLQALKEILNTDRAVIAIAAGSIMSIIQIWQSYDVTSLYHNFKNEIDEQFIDSKNGYIILGFIIQEAPIIICKQIYNICKIYCQKHLVIGQCIKIFDRQNSRFFDVFFIKYSLIHLQKQSFRFKDVLLYYHFNYVIIHFHSCLNIKCKFDWYSEIKLQNLRIVIWFNLNVHQYIQYLGYQCFELIAQYKLQQQILRIATVKLTIIYGFAFCYSIIGIVLSKMLQFVKQFNEAMKEGKQNYQRQLFLK
ncbi:unnamed protein product [Paramecium primaurelia]|uniref:Uncharacterized protein n=1 Tax=Paramecium primaurelia TaxID=5886 RepID=A0A8S1NTK7_PARPR|nr:unnamed protein product [Paramecium primaurelia]